MGGELGISNWTVFNFMLFFQQQQLSFWSNTNSQYLYFFPSHKEL